MDIYSRHVFRVCILFNLFAQKRDNMNDFTKAIIGKIILHERYHKECGLKVCPMVLSRDEMDAILIHISYLFIPNRDSCTDDIIQFHGVRLVVDE